MKSGKKRSIARVAFGSPTAAQYHIDSPSVSYTPMPKNAARASFSMEQGGDTPSDEATASNSCILQSWETAAAEQGTSIAPPTSAASRRSAKRRSSGIFKAGDEGGEDTVQAAEQLVDASSPESLAGETQLTAGAHATAAVTTDAELHDTVEDDDDSFMSSGDEAGLSTRNSLGGGHDSHPGDASDEEEEEEEEDMDTRLSLDPTEAANLLLRGRRSSVAPSARRRSSIAPAGGVKRGAEGPLDSQAPYSTASSKRSRRSSVGGTGLAVRSPRVLSRARDSISSIATPDMAALLSDPLLAEGEDEITFAGTPSHTLSAKQLRRAAAMSSASKASGGGAGGRRSSIGSFGGGDRTEDLGSLVDLLQETGTLNDTAASVGSAHSRRSAGSAQSRGQSSAGGRMVTAQASDEEEEEEDDMDTRLSLDPTAAARVAAELAAAAPPAGQQHPAPIHEDDDGSDATEEEEDDDEEEDEEEDEDLAHAPDSASDRSSVLSDNTEEKYNAACEEEEALLMEAGITPTHRPASRGARTSADRISVAASVRAEHARAADDSASPVVAQGEESPLAPPTALTFDSEDDAETSPRRKSVSPATSLARSHASRRSTGAAVAPSPAGTAGSSADSPAASGEAPLVRESVSPAAAASPQRPSWAVALRAPGIVQAGTVMNALQLPLEVVPIASIQHGAVDKLVSQPGMQVHWALTTTSAQQAAGIVGVGVPSVAHTAAETVVSLSKTAAGPTQAAALAASAALTSICARVLLPHARAMQWATGELQKQIAVSSGEIEAKLAGMSVRNPALFRQFKAAAVRGGVEAQEARLGMQALYLQQGATAAVRFQDWKLKMTSALAAAFEKGLKQASTAADRLATLTDKCNSVAHAVAVENQAELQQAADVACQQCSEQQISALRAAAAKTAEEAAGVQAACTAAAARVAALKAQVAQMAAQVDEEEKQAASADAAAAAVDDITPEQALAATSVARTQLECVVALSGWSLADASTAVGDTVLRTVVHTAVGQMRVPLGTVTLRCPAAAGAAAPAAATVEFVAAPASSEPRTQAQREALALASYLVHSALAHSMGRASAGCALHSLLAAVQRGCSTGAAAACDLIKLSLMHKVEVQRGSPLPRALQAGTAAPSVQASSVSVTLTHRQQRGKVVLCMQLMHGQQSGAASATWRIGGSAAAKGALQAAAAGAGASAGWMMGFVQAVDDMDFAA